MFLRHSPAAAYHDLLRLLIDDQMSDLHGTHFLKKSHWCSQH